jgi:hypothetical protein
MPLLGWVVRQQNGLDIVNRRCTQALKMNTRFSASGYCHFQQFADLARKLLAEISQFIG